VRRKIVTMEKLKSGEMNIVCGGGFNQEWRRKVEVQRISNNKNYVWQRVGDGEWGKVNAGSL